MQRRRLNVKLICWLGAGTVLCVVGAYFLRGYQVRRNAGALYTLAKQAEEQGELKKAAGYLRQYVRLRPDDSQGYAFWATVAADRAESPQATRNDIAMAMRVLESAVLKAPELDDLRERLVDLSMNYGRLNDAKAHLEVLLDHRPDDDALVVLYARCLISEARYQQAADRLYGLIGYDPTTKTFDPKQATGVHNIDAYVVLAELLRSEMEAPEIAQQTMDQMVAANNGAFRAYLERGRYRLRRGERDDAKQDIAKAMELEPDDAEVILVAAELALDEEDFATSRKHLARGLEKYPDDERMYRLSAMVELNETDDAAAALGHIEQGLKALPGNHLLMTFQAHLQLRSRDLQAVEQTIASMEAADIAPEWLDFLRARILLVQENWVEAARQFERLRPLMARRPDVVLQINLFLGQCYEQLGQWDRALEAYRLALGADARQVRARQGVNRMLIATGRTSLERSDVLESKIEQVLRTPKQQRDWDSLEPWIERFADERELSEARRVVLRAEILILRGQHEKAREILADARQQYADEVSLWLVEAKAIQQQFAGKEGLEKALALLDLAESQLGQRSDLRLSKALMLVQLQPDDLITRLAAIEEDAEQLPKEGRVRFWTGMGSIYLAGGARGAARRCWNKAGEIEPGDLRIRQRLFELAYEEGDDDAMRQAIEGIRNILGTEQDSVWQYCQAARLVAAVRAGRRDEDALDEADALIDEALKLRPSWNDLFRLRATINLHRQQYDEAIVNFNRAFELGPPHPVAVRQLVQVLSLKGQYAEAQRALELLSSERRRAIFSPELLSEIRMRTGDVAQGVQLARDAVNRDPDNALKLLWYGQVLWRAGEAEAAEKALERAMEVSPEQPQVWLAMIRYLVLNDRAEKAQDLLGRAESLLPKDQLPVAMAQCHEVLGNGPEAERYYHQALIANPRDLALLRAVASFYLSPIYFRDDGPQRASGYLRQMFQAEDQQQGLNEDIAWARRTMARLIAARGTYPDLQEAMKLIEANEVQGQLRPDDRLLAATILAARPEGVSRRKAIRLLEELQDTQALGVRHQLILAELYKRAGNWPKCLAQMRFLLGQHGSDKLVLATYCRMLLEKEQLDQLQRWIENLQQVDPDGPATVSIRAGLLVKQGKSAEAVELVTSRLPEKIDQENLPQWVQAISLLEQLKEFAAAEKLLRRYVELEPRAQLVLAQFLGLHTDVDEAFATLDRAAASQPLLPIIRAAVIILRQRRAEVGDRYDSQVQRWLDRAMQNAPDSLPLLLQLAAFRDVQGDYEQEEVLYRKLLKREDLGGHQRALVLNNLAFNLAMRDRGDEGGMDLVTQAIKIRGPTGALLDTRAMVSLSVGDYSRAIADLNLAISDEPKATRYFHLALAQLASGDKQAAHNAYLEATERGLVLDAISKLERKKFDHLIKELGVEPLGRAG